MNEHEQLKFSQATYFFDYTHPIIQTKIKEWTSEATSLKEKAIELYYAIRDGYYYNPYKINFAAEYAKSSDIINRKEGHCLDKATLLISCCRAIGIPSKLHLVKVKNHIAVEKLVEAYGTDELTPHAFAELYIDGKWVKATPAFNRSLCDLLNVDVLEFDGETDSLFQEYDKDGGQFMEYLEDYGCFDDLPMEFIVENMKAHYPGIERYAETDELVEIIV